MYNEASITFTSYYVFSQNSPKLFHIHLSIRLSNQSLVSLFVVICRPISRRRKQKKLQGQSLNRHRGLLNQKLSVKSHFNTFKWSLRSVSSSLISFVVIYPFLFKYLTVHVEPPTVTVYLKDSYNILQFCHVTMIGESLRIVNWLE